MSEIDVKYQQLGGALGFLGPPTSDERPAPRGGSVREYAKGAIFFHPDTGAFEVEGEIRHRWGELGDVEGALGYPTSDETTTTDGRGRLSRFQGGLIVWSANTGAHLVTNELARKWSDTGERVLGFPCIEPQPTIDGVATFQRFELGVIYSTRRGQFEVRGSILERYRDLGSEGGLLGLPTSDELFTADGRGRLSRFEGGEIVFTPASESFALTGVVLDEWRRRGGEVGSVGYPKSDSSATLCGTGQFARFDGGTLHVYPPCKPIAFPVAPGRAAERLSTIPGDGRLSPAEAGAVVEGIPPPLVGPVRRDLPADDRLSLAEGRAIAEGAPPSWFAEVRGDLPAGMLRVRSRVLDLVHRRPLVGAHVTVTATLLRPPIAMTLRTSPFSNVEVVIPSPLERLGTISAMASDHTDDLGFIGIDLFFDQLSDVLVAGEEIGFDRVRLEIRVDFRDLEGIPALPFEKRIGQEGSASGTYDDPIFVDLATAHVGHTTETSTRLWFLVNPPIPVGDELRCDLVDPSGVTRSLYPSLAQAPGHTGTVDFTGLTPDQVHQYRLCHRQQDESGPGFTLVAGTVRTAAAASTSLRVAFASCHQPSHQFSLERWEHLERSDHDLLLLLGDQIYESGLPTVGEDDYARQYLKYWHWAPMRRALARAPTYMMWDDHEVYDDFGSIARDVERFEGARRAYIRFQDSHNPGHGARTRLHYHFRRGPVAFFVLDLRSHRGEDNEFPVLGRSQSEEFAQWAHSSEALAADIIVIVSTVPFGFLPAANLLEVMSDLDLKIREVAATAGAVATLFAAGIIVAASGGTLGVGGAVASMLVGATTFTAGVAVAEDVLLDGEPLDTATDLADHWTHPSNQRDLERVLSVLDEISRDGKRRAVLILSGDVHVGAIHRLYRSDALGGTADPFAVQITSSPISREPATGIERLFFNAMALHIKADNVPSVAEILDGVFGRDDRIVDTRTPASFVLDDEREGRFAAETLGVLADRNVGRLEIRRPDPDGPYVIDIGVDAHEDAVSFGFDFYPDPASGGPVYRNSRFSVTDWSVSTLAAAARETRRLAVLGVSLDGSVRHREQRACDSIFWTAPTAHGRPMGHARGATLIEDSDKRLFAAVVGEDRSVWYAKELRTDHGEPWAPWKRLDGCLHEVTAIAGDEGNTTLVGIGENHQLLIRRWLAPQELWDGRWTSIGGAWSTFVAQRDYKGDLVIVAIDRNGRVFRTTQRHKLQFERWKDLGREGVALALVHNTNRLLELFVATGDEVLHQNQRGPNVPSWSDWGRLEMPAVQVVATAALDWGVTLVGRKTDGEILASWQTELHSDGTHGWGGGPWSSPVALTLPSFERSTFIAAAATTRRVVVFATNSRGQVRVMEQARFRDTTFTASNARW